MMASVIVCNGSETNKNQAVLAVRFANTAPRENAGSIGVAQAVSRRLLTAEVRGFAVDKVALGQASLRVLLFSSVNIIPL
jgi:hypothetical protein